MRKIELQSEDVIELAQDLASVGVGMTYRATLRGKSMLPFIRPGDTITVHPVSPDRIRKRDVLVFRRDDGALVAHRLIRIEQASDGPRFVTRGDSVLREDRPLKVGDVLGCVQSVTHGGRTKRMDGFLRRLGVLCWLLLYPVPQRIAPGIMRLIRTKKTPRRNGAFDED